MLDPKLIEKSHRYYVYVCLVNDSPVYVGKGTGKRYLHCVSGKSSSVGLNRDFFLWGKKAFEINIVDYDLSEDDAYTLERMVINNLISQGYDLYNCDYQSMLDMSNKPSYHPSKSMEVNEMTTVVNKYKVDMSDPDVVYVGRGSVWGNDEPMKDKSDEERARVIECYRHQLWKQINSGEITKEMLLELDGKRLACYCFPRSCHADVIIRAIEWAKEK